MLLDGVEKETSGKKLVNNFRCWDWGSEWRKKQLNSTTRDSYQQAICIITVKNELCTHST